MGLKLKVGSWDLGNVAKLQLSFKSTVRHKILSTSLSGAQHGFKKSGKTGDKPRWRFEKTFLIVTSTKEYTSIGTKSGKM